MIYGDIQKDNKERPR